MPRTVHPGETLSAMLGERCITQFRLARAITADTALRLGRALGTTA